MKAARTKIDVYAGTLSMEFGDIIVHFNILDAMKHPSEDLSIFRAKIIDHVVEATWAGEPLQNTRSQTKINKAAVAPAPTNEKVKKVVEVKEENEDEGGEEYNSNASESDGFQEHNDLILKRMKILISNLVLRNLYLSI